MRGSTLPFAPMKTYGLVSVNLREKWNLFFFSLSPIRFSLSLFAFSSFLFFPLSFFIHPNFPSLVCSPSHFFFIFHFLFSFFFSSIFLHFLFSISLFDYHQSNGPKVGETSPHFPPLPLVFFTNFLNFFFIFISLFFLLLTLGSM